ncbi:hypothetical protein EVAR_48949_1 [Eumeta japonica]|uniref:Uncharacterized protein n=1 Tax=Eumeta variegata TaxID=151549 RepID=A0A4C1Y3Z3_EUMVA|nr:hypothetical protein EVAR_48949_1 [Eumeta japonica]
MTFRSSFGYLAAVCSTCAFQFESSSIPSHTGINATISSLTQLANFLAYVDKFGSSTNFTISDPIYQRNFGHNPYINKSVSRFSHGRKIAFLFLHTYTVPGPPGRRRGRALPSRSGGCADGPGPGGLSGGRSRPGPGLRRRPGPPGDIYRAGAPGRRRGRAPRPGPGLRRGPGPPGAAEAGARPGPGCAEARAPPPVRGRAAGRSRPGPGCADGPGPPGRSRAGPGGWGCADGPGPPVRACRPPAAAERWRCVGAPGPGPGDAGAPWTAPGAAGRVLRWSVSMRARVEPALRADVDNGGEGEVRMLVDCYRQPPHVCRPRRNVVLLSSV